METYRLHDEVKEWAFSIEMPTTAVTDHPYLTHVATLALFNKTGSGKMVRVRQIKAERLLAQTTKTAIGTTLALYRITAHTASEEPMTAYSMDTDNASLPSQVEMYRRPFSVTTSGTPIDSTCAVPCANEARALGHMVSRMAGAQEYQDVYVWVSDTGNEVQKVVLREGEGISLSTNGVTNAFPHWLEASVTVRNSSSGACYRYNFPTYFTPLPVFSLLNGSGSGVVLEVVRVGLREIGTDVLPQVTVERIDGIDETSGYSSTPDPFDTVNSLDANIIGRGNVKVTMDGSKRGAFMVIPHLAYKIGAGLGVGPNLSGFHPQNQDSHHTSQPFAGRYPHEDLHDICLREGEGIGIFQRSASGRIAFDLMIQFTVEGVTGGYPPESKVENNYVFGPNDEYTGSLAGGSTYSRSRVVNR